MELRFLRCTDDGGHGSVDGIGDGCGRGRGDDDEDCGDSNAYVSGTCITSDWDNETIHERTHGARSSHSEL